MKTRIDSRSNLGSVELNYVQLYNLTKIVSYKEAHEVPPKPFPGMPYKTYSLK